MLKSRSPSSLDDLVLLPLLEFTACACTSRNEMQLFFLEECETSVEVLLFCEEPSSPVVLLVVSPVTQVLYCLFYLFWKHCYDETKSGFCGSVAFLWASSGLRIAEARKRARGGKVIFTLLFPFPTLCSYAPRAQTFERAAVCEYAHFVCVCVCGVCMKDWCWPKYLPSCVRPGTHGTRERGGEKRVVREGADATDRDAYQ